MSVSIIDDPETAILTRVIGQDDSTLSLAVAQEFLRWTFTESDRQRMSELAAKARAGTLTSQEQAEADGYERVGSFLGIVKSKARRSLQSLSGQ
jgi:uncharacterized protein YnzC (UPF0291/DUF896 family)